MPANKRLTAQEWVDQLNEGVQSDNWEENAIEEAINSDAVRNFAEQKGTSTNTTLARDSTVKIYQEMQI